MIAAVYRCGCSAQEDEYAQMSRRHKNNVNKKIEGKNNRGKIKQQDTCLPYVCIAARVALESEYGSVFCPWRIPGVGTIEAQGGKTDMDSRGERESENIEGSTIPAVLRHDHIAHTRYEMRCFRVREQKGDFYSSRPTSNNPAKGGLCRATAGSTILHASSGLFLVMMEFESRIRSSMAMNCAACPIHKVCFHVLVDRTGLNE